MAASNGPFQLRSRPGILSKDNVYLLDNRAVAMHLQPHVPQHWVPDERDNFISWLRSEFAAANAIIDAFCHHLRLIGNAGEYDLVFACLQQRRYNWNVILHLQQYFSVADIMVALQQVAQKKQHALTVDPMPTQNVDGIGLKNNAINGVHAHKQQSLNTRAVEQTIAKRRTPESLDRPKDDSEKGKNQLENDGKENYPATLEPTRHPSVTQGLLEYKVPENVVPNNQPHLQATSSSPPLASHGQKSSEWRKRNSQNRLGLASKKREGYTSKSSINLKFNSKPEEDARFAAIKVSKQFKYYEDIEGQTINLVEGLELYESIFDNEESRRLELLVADLNSAGKPTENDNKEDIADLIPAPLQVLIDRLVRWHIIPYNKRPDSGSFIILEKGDSAIADFNSVDLEQPIFLISLLSECSLVLSSKTARAGSTTDIKDPLKLFLPVGSVLVLQGNSAKVAIHSLSAMSEKCCHIILGKTAAKKGSQIGNPTTPKPLDFISATEVEASNLPGAKVAVNSGKTQTLSNTQNVGVAASVVLPLRLTIPSGKTPSEVHKPTLQPLFSATASHQVGPFSPVTVLVPGWSPMPKIVRTSSAGTGVFLPSNTSSSGPGRPPNTNPQRRQGILTTPMQRTASSPAFFPSSNGDFRQATPSRSPALLQSNPQPSVGTLQPAESASNSYLLPSHVHMVPLSESSSALQSADFTLNSRA